MTLTERRQGGGKAPPEPVAVLRGHTSDVQAVAFTSLGVLASGCVHPLLQDGQTRHSSCIPQFMSHAGESHALRRCPLRRPFACATGTQTAT